MTDPIVAELRRRAADSSRCTDSASQFPVKAHAPLDGPSISQAEKMLGRKLPALLRDAYEHVGNGGFGPGYGLLPLLANGEQEDETVVDLYAAFGSADPEDSAWSWPVHLVPFCDWGCAIRSCVDCSSADGAVVTFDPNVRGIGEPMLNAFAQTHPTLRAWFSDWIAGVEIWNLMYEPDPARATAGINPFTKEPMRIIPNRLRRP